MIGIEEYNNESIRMNTASRTCDNNKETKLKYLSKEFINLCYSENRQMSVKCGLKHDKIQDIVKTT